VQEMVVDAQEMFVGVSHDVTFGPVLTFGLGGIFVEVLKDLAFRLAPLTAEEALRGLRELRAFKLLEGARGQAACDIDALVDCLVRVSWLAVDLGDRIAELDINPLSVLAKGRGARVVDALIISHPLNAKISKAIAS
jgi:acyl-CoA synthetase (NDP forming)